MLEPTSPFRKKNTVKRCLDILKRNKNYSMSLLSSEINFLVKKKEIYSFIQK